MPMFETICAELKTGFELPIVTSRELLPLLRFLLRPINGELANTLAATHFKHLFSVSGGKDKRRLAVALGCLEKVDHGTAVIAATPVLKAALLFWFLSSNAKSVNTGSDTNPRCGVFKHADLRLWGLKDVPDWEKLWEGSSSIRVA